MFKKAAFILLVFIVLLVYLHQKTIIYVEAYKLGALRSRLDKLVDMRDSLLYSFSKEVSLAKVNLWVENNGLTIADTNKVLAFNIGNGKSRHNRLRITNSKIASSFKHIHIPGISKAMAKEQQRGFENR